MGVNDKVVWREGTFLRPQHFQQTDRRTEWLVEARAGALRPYPWGAVELTLDAEMLALGKVAVSSGRVVLPDGTPLALGGDAGPAPRQIPAGTVNQTVYLCLPVRRADAVDTGTSGEGGSRFLPAFLDLRDTSGSAPDPARVEVAVPRLSLRLESEPRDDFVSLGIARVQELDPSGAVLLDARYLRPALDCRAEPALQGFAREVAGLLRSRGAALGGRLHQPGMGGVSEMNDFLMLQVVNRAQPLFAHFATLAGLHPEELYRAAVQLAGELAAFTGQDRQAPEFPVYRHDDLAASYRPVMETLRRQLSAVLQESAIALPIQEGKYGVYVSALNDRSVLRNHRIVLAVAADVPPETVRGSFPAQVKIGPVENIRDLVNLQLPGIPLSPMPVAPRELPYHAGFTYFELDQSHELWTNLGSSGGFAFHVSGGFPGLRMEFWAIRAGLTAGRP